MSNNAIILSCIGVYLCLLIILGLVARKKRKSNTLKDFYLAGRDLGPMVLLFTLYATQYSANTILVTPAEVVNTGLGMILIMGYLTAVVIFYLTFAPQLYRICKQRNFITPGDWFDYRFNLPPLTLVANIILVVVSVNFLLSQLMAMGHIANGLTDGLIPYWSGVVFLAFVVIIYESLGGMRAVVWTDVLQGLMLFVGLGGLFIIIMPNTNSLTQISEWLIQNEPEKIGVPTGEFQIYWASTIFMVGLGAAVYPQVIQRIYAAKSVKALKRSLGAMVFMPLITVLILLIMGMVSIPHFADSNQVAHDAIFPEMLRFWSNQSTMAFALSVLVIVGLLAAIMSTADSVLLSLSSILAKDILGKSVMKNASEQKLTKVGKTLSWIIMVIAVLVALQPKITLWGLIELKMQILIQTAPLYLLGIYSNKISSRALLWGICVGSMFALIAFFLQLKTIGGIQVGLVGILFEHTRLFCCL